MHYLQSITNYTIIKFKRKLFYLYIRSSEIAVWLIIFSRYKFLKENSYVFYRKVKKSLKSYAVTTDCSCFSCRLSFRFNRT